MYGMLRRLSVFLYYTNAEIPYILKKRYLISSSGGETRQYFKKSDSLLAYERISGRRLLALQMSGEDYIKKT